MVSGDPRASVGGWSGRIAEVRYRCSGPASAGRKQPFIDRNSRLLLLWLPPRVVMRRKRDSQSRVTKQTARARPALTRSPFYRLAGDCRSNRTARLFSFASEAAAGRDAEGITPSAPHSERGHGTPALWSPSRKSFRCFGSRTKKSRVRAKLRVKPGTARISAGTCVRAPATSPEWASHAISLARAQ